MVAANAAGSTIDLPRRNERPEEQMASGHNARWRSRGGVQTAFRLADRYNAIPIAMRIAAWPIRFTS